MNLEKPLCDLLYFTAHNLIVLSSSPYQFDSGATFHGVNTKMPEPDVERTADPRYPPSQGDSQHRGTDEVLSIARHYRSQCDLPEKGRIPNRQ
jgi:hypothetical protein